ncbi:MAG: hypothetical protein K6G11_04565 [Lachnospiraceae bacterium]|nr:hypothetical protein [Lachnospiraceae bacterium]
MNLDRDFLNNGNVAVNAINISYKKSSLFKNMKKTVDNKRGSAIIVVTIVMAVIAFVCLSLLLVSYQMISATTDDKATDKYYRQVESFSDVLKMRLNSGKQTDANSIEGFIYEFMSDDKNYPATSQTSSNVEFSADSPTGEGGEKYCGMEIRLKKDLATGRDDDVDENANNGWNERREYYCTIKVSAISGEEKLSSITQKHLFYLADTSYNYYTESEDAEPTYYKIDAEDNDYIVIPYGETSVKANISSLMSSKGAYELPDGTQITIKRSLNKSNTTYKFEFLGWS